ncbi:MAG: helix-turn-helix domain-containing protein [Campylobacterota bacterium]|nr:helix-turn-helix domain-containing protein [Campylobacterota bacterium]
MYLKQFREYFKLSQRDFAEKIGIAQTALARYETGKVNPTTPVIQKYIDIFDANPNFLFLGSEPKQITIEEDELTLANRALIDDLINSMPGTELNHELKKILVGNIIDILAKENDKKVKSPLRRFLESIKLEGHIPFRPLLFLYYVFRYMQDNEDKIKQIPNNGYQNYLIELTSKYKILSLKNNPAFTMKIKEEIIGSIKLHLNENDSRILILNYKQALENIESKMSTSIVVAHRKIDTKTLFPK